MLGRKIQEHKVNETAKKLLGVFCKLQIEATSAFINIKQQNQSYRHLSGGPFDFKLPHGLPMIRR